MLRFDPTAQQFVNDTAIDEQIADRDAALDLLTREMYALSHLLRERFVGPVSPYEAASWQAKASEAAQGGGPILTLEAQVRGVTLADMIARVLANAQAFGQMEALLAGNTGRHRDAAALLATREEVLAYDWRSGWPM